MLEKLIGNTPTNTNTNPNPTGTSQYNPITKSLSALETKVSLMDTVELDSLKAKVGVVQSSMKTFLSTPINNNSNNSSNSNSSGGKKVNMSMSAVVESAVMIEEMFKRVSSSRCKCRCGRCKCK